MGDPTEQKFPDNWEGWSKNGLSKNKVKNTNTKKFSHGGGSH